MESSDGINLDRIVGILRRRLPIILACTVFAGGAALSLSKSQTKMYSAAAQILFRDPGLATQAAGLANMSNPAPERTSATNVRLVTLGNVPERTARTIGEGVTGAQVSDAVESKSAGTSDIAAVSATWSDPSMAARIANAYSEQFVASRRESARNTLNKATALVAQQLAELSRAQRSGARGQALSDRLESLRVLGALQTGNVEIVQAASTPRSPSSPAVMRNTSVGLALGLVLGIVAAFVLTRFDRRLRDLEEIEGILQLPLLGVVPDNPRHKTMLSSVRDDRVVVREPTDLEAFRMLRAHLRYFNVDRTTKTVLVTSASPGEGKTTVALNLAEAAATVGTKVILLEADLRKPTLGNRLHVRRGGLAQLLIDADRLEQALPEAITPLTIEGPHHGTAWPMDVIVAGGIPPNPIELLESEAMARVLRALAERYDLVVIDSPPLSFVSDAVPLFRSVDGVLVVARVGVSTRDAVRRLRERLQALRAPVLGVVANAVSGRSSYGYGYGYGYGDDSANGTPKTTRRADSEPVEASASPVDS